jgi:Restriction endonuclease
VFGLLSADHKAVAELSPMDLDNTNKGKTVTGAEAGLSGDDQIRIALQTIQDRGGVAQMPNIYQAVEKRLNGPKLSAQGRASLRTFANRVAVQAGYVYPHDRNNPGWRITPEGRDFLGTAASSGEEVLNVDTDQTEVHPSSTARATAFEHYVLRLLKMMYPHYAWFHQGLRKGNERGLDLIGSQIGEGSNQTHSIGVQVKLHSSRSAPSLEEWLKFLAGCFARRVSSAMFITTGRLTSEQRREAGEADVLVIEGQEEIKRIAELYGVEEFELYEEPPKAIRR